MSAWSIYGPSLYEAVCSYGEVHGFVLAYLCSFCRVERWEALVSRGQTAYFSFDIYGQYQKKNKRSGHARLGRPSLAWPDRLFFF